MTERDQLAQELSLATVRFARYLRGRTDRSTVSLSQLSTLHALADSGPLTPGQLAAREQVRPPTVTRLIASLVHLGLVRRTAHPTDRRQAVLGLSQQGENVIEGEAAARENWLRTKLDALPAHERTALSDATRILSAILESETHPTQPCATTTQGAEIGPVHQ